MTRIRKTHQWLRDRNIKSAFLVLRLSDYATVPASRGQFYVAVPRTDDMNKAVWPTYDDALGAASWATRKFGHQYGVFKMVTFVEPREQPVMVSVIRT